MNSRITIKDKQFKPYIAEKTILEAVKRIAGCINEELKHERPLFLVVLNGSFMFASDLMKELHLDCEISFVKLSTYEGTRSTGNVTELIGLTETINGRMVVILEDIVDSGNTVNYLVQYLSNKGAASIKIASALYKPKAYKHKHTIHYVGLEIESDFVVGYGLDYNGLGRNLRDIYVLA